MDLNLIAPMNQLGYGQVGKNILRSLSLMSGVNVALFPMARINPNDVKDIAHHCTESIKRAEMPNWNAPCIRLWHQHDMAQFVGDGPRIGFPIFELDTFTEQEEYHLNNLDKVFVCSHWAKDVIVKETKHFQDDVHVVPLGVNTLDDWKCNQGDTTRFFTCGKWEIRKGHDAIIEAFNLAFDDNDNVELHMMCSNPFLNAQQHKDWEDMYLNSELGHKVRFLPRVETHEEVLKVMGSMDCGVFISRAEGWNLELLEMMSLGKPVIATNYSGHTEFCNSSNSLLVDVDELEPAYDGIWFHGQGNWAKLDPDQIGQTAQHMMNVHEQKSGRSGLTFANTEGTLTGKEFTWHNTATEILNGIDSFRDF